MQSQLRRRPNAFNLLRQMSVLELMNRAESGAQDEPFASHANQLAKGKMLTQDES